MTNRNNDDNNNNGHDIEYLLMLPSEQSTLNENSDISSITSFGSNETEKLLVQYLNERPMLKSFMVGSLSGTCSTLLFQPFDLLKTRVQNAHLSSLAISRNQSVPASAMPSTRFVTVTYETIKNEQIIGLWRGTAPSLLRCVPGIGIHFCCLDTLQSHFCPDRRPSAIEAMTFGMMSRSIAAVLLIPVTVVKTRYESGSYAYQSIVDALRHTYRNEGLRGLKSGLLPTLMRDVPYSGLYYMFYSQMKNFMLTKNADEIQRNSQQYSKIISSSSITFACGVSAGLLASAVTQPMDVVKTRMQVNTKQYPSFLKTTLSIVKEEKIRGLFAGLVPRMMRRTLMASMAWTVYEQMMRSLCLK
ncbi:solute carrier family 25 member 38-like protein [Dermatophagoides farinae]|uniref:Mitochondrial glycine transporter n=2 Tax=Dermatophagoides farinae TaxID=6954 RepID=A0A9D4P882_DERFA|nr:solute carrier family 25 member 38-like protein [Dermatophagoides farinae]